MPLAIIHIYKGILRSTFQVGAGLCVEGNDSDNCFPLKIKPIKIKALKQIEVAVRPKFAVVKHAVLLER